MTRHRNTAPALILALLGVACGAFGQQSIEAGGLTLTWDQAAGTVLATSAFEPGLVRNLRVALNDGHSDGPLALTVEEARVAEGALIVRYSCPKPLAIAATYAARGEGLIVTVTVRNGGDEQEWIEPVLQAELGEVGELSVFDGHTALTGPEPEFNDEFFGRMQICSAWNAGASLGIGLAAGEIRSYLDHSYHPATADGPAVLSTSTRLVLDPGSEDTVSFWAASRPGEWGFYESLEAYYRTEPAMFRRDPQVDPRVDLGGAEYRAWPASRFSPEICRRLYAGWDWCYAPFKRTGDIVGRERFWNYQPAREPSGVRALPRDEFLKWRHEQFAAGRACDVLMSFYVPSQVWCEEQLAREVYPDALVEDPNTRTLFTTPWVTGHDNERLVFPYLTTFGEQSRIDMREVAEELDLRAFAFDTAGGNGKYRGPALPDLDGRAWDENGVYCRGNVAVAHLMQFVHTLQAQDGTRVAVISNPNPRCAYSSVVWSDSMMLEGEPWKVDRSYGDSLRWMAGQKTLTWWEGYAPETFVDLEQATDEQLAMLIRGLADFTLLQSFRIGFIPPPNYTQGVGRLVKWLPALVECVTTGWEPVQAARVPEPLWATRYGSGLDTLICVAHETDASPEAKIAIENGRLAEGALLFSDYDGSRRTNTIVDGETHITSVVPKRTPVLLRAQAEVQPANAVTQAVVSADLGLTGGTLSLMLTGKGEATVRVRVPPRMVISEVNGAPWGIEGNEVTVLLGGDARETEITYTSMDFHGTDSELIDFPFANEGGATSTIYVRQDAGETEQHLAERLSLYFDYWYGRIRGGEEPHIPIVRGEPSAPGAFIRGDVDEARVEVVDGVLLIGARDDAELERIFMRYLRALDTKYWAADLGVGASWLRRAKGDDPWLTWPQ